MKKTLTTLNLADIVSLLALLFSWISIVLLLKNDPLGAIAVSMGAFLLDMLDGYIYRKFNYNTTYGKVLDSFVDTVTYVIFSSLMYYMYLSFISWVSLILSYMVLAFGILRLVRVSGEGILLDSADRKYYRGVTVVHIYLLTIICFYLSRLLVFWTPWISSAVLLVVAPFMISNYKTYKIQNYLVLVLTTVCVIITALLLKYVY